MKNLIDSQSQKCWAELIDKESATRINWKEKYGDTFSLIPDTAPKKVPKVFQLPARDVVLPAIRSARRQEGTRRVVAVQGPMSGPVEEMRGVSPQIRGLLYDGFSKEQRGRHQYLRKRAATLPEDKYYYPVLSSWTYGWRQGDVVGELQLPAHGRLRIINNTFFRRNGIFHNQSVTDGLAR
ncbi:protein ATP6V1FNB [Amblyraja radiata]|uniref:protein ATP6V1FNB n=1 Tax=Amblyraja radiata TaxID=386614 RepID=UPI0014023E2D|nr:protein ATP6V1FNB [Amblyraja radiata]